MDHIFFNLKSRMVNTRKNRKSTRKSSMSRRNRRGGGFFDFFRSKPAAVAPAPAPVANNKVRLNNYAPGASIPATSPGAGTAPPPPVKRSMRNRMRGVTSNLGTHFKAMRNTWRNRKAFSNNMNKTAYGTSMGY
jgi:hypothetical protein